jgi:Fe-S cluster assembly ATP-binding protein
MALLEIKDLHVALEDGTEIVKGVDLAVDLNQKHAIMGPNGSGKSTLAYALMGHPAYQVTGGQILLDGDDITELGADERAQRGLFLAFQYPHAIPGVTVTSFLRSAINAIRKVNAGGEDDPIPIPEFRKELDEAMTALEVSRELASRYVNDGFSGGERKRVEVLQLAMLKPRIAIRTRRIRGSTSTLSASSPAESIRSSARTWGRSSSRTISGFSTTSCPTTSTCS